MNFAHNYNQKADTRTHLSSDEIEMLPIKLRIIYILISDLDIRDIDYLDEKKIDSYIMHAMITLNIIKYLKNW